MVTIIAISFFPADSISSRFARSRTSCAWARRTSARGVPRCTATVMPSTKRASGARRVRCENSCRASTTGLPARVAASTRANSPASSPVAVLHANQGGSNGHNGFQWVSPVAPAPCNPSLLPTAPCADIHTRVQLGRSRFTNLRGEWPSLPRLPTRPLHVPVRRVGKRPHGHIPPAVHRRTERTPAPDPDSAALVAPHSRLGLRHRHLGNRHGRVCSAPARTESCGPC